MDEAQEGAAYPEPAFDRLPDRNGDLAGIERDQLSPEVLRAGILRDGCLLIRGAVDRDAALALAEGIDRAFQAREKAQENYSAERRGDPWGRRGNEARMYYSEFTPTPRFRKALSRDWIQGGGGLWVADSPHLLFEMLDAFERAGLEAAIAGYLGEPALISVQKCTLRKVDPDAGRGWHQDGAFMGDVRALNVWLSLSHCGDEAPGMDVVPRRLDGILTSGQEGADFNWSISEQVAEEAAGETGIVRPIFEPGDVLLFDDLSCIPRRQSRRCPRVAWRSKAGSSAPRLRRRSIRRLQPSRAAEPERFFFVHMQKTGGTSLFTRTKRQFGEAGVYPNDSDGDTWDMAPQLMVPVLLERWPKRRDQIRLIGGHFPLCTRELLDADFRTFTVLRQPVERTLSYLRHHRELNPTDLTLEEMYEDRAHLMHFRHFIGNHMVKMLSLRSDEMTDGMMTLVDLTVTAWRKPRGRWAKWTSSASRKTSRASPSDSSATDWRLGAPRRDQPTRPVKVSRSLRRRIAEDTALDRELYEYAQELARG